MYCPKHPLTELMVRMGRTEKREGKVCIVQELYCPHCGTKPTHLRVIDPSGQVKIEENKQ